MTQQDTDIALIKQEVKHIKDMIITGFDTIDKKIDASAKEHETFVTKQHFLDKFTPIEKLVYGVVALILIAFMSGLTALVFVV